MKKLLTDFKTQFELCLKEYFNSLEIVEPLFSGIKYSVNNGGKRLRPLLVKLGAGFVGADFKKVEKLAIAIELIHSYSLVHDDLPAMDNDTLRRGLPTTHIKYGEGMAILVGDALLNLAYETLFSDLDSCDINYLKAAKVLADSAGCQGMIKGQCLDIDEKAGKTLNEIILTYKCKTSALMKAALIAGACAAGASQKELCALGEYADNLGLIFQIVDDILDITSTEQTLGKNINSDLESGKITYVSVRGLEQSKSDIAVMEQAAKDALAPFGDKASTLITFLEYLSNRSF